MREQTLKEITNRATKYNEKVALKAGFPGAAWAVAWVCQIHWILGYPIFRALGLRKNHGILDHLLRNTHIRIASHENYENCTQPITFVVSRHDARLDILLNSCHPVIQLSVPFRFRGSHWRYKSNIRSWRASVSSRRSGWAMNGP